MPTLRITQTRSTIGRLLVQRRTMFALGLRKVGDSVEQPDRPEIRGMLSRVSHLVSVDHVEDSA